MKDKRLILLLILLITAFDLKAQLNFDKDNDLISFSETNSKVKVLKNYNEINIFNLSSYNNDSIFWENNIQFLDPSYNSIVCRRKAGFIIDTTIQYFDLATKIEIDEGYLWLLKITSPTAFELGFSYSNVELNKNQYLSIHSNLHDSIDGVYQFELPEILLVNDGVDSTHYKCKKDTCLAILWGKDLYVEFFSPSDVDLIDLKLFNIFYGYSTRYKLSDAPNWFRKKHPEIDFDFYEKLNKR